MVRGRVGRDEWPVGKKRCGTRECGVFHVCVVAVRGESVGGGDRAAGAEGERNERNGDERSTRDERREREEPGEVHFERREQRNTSACLRMAHQESRDASADCRQRW